MIPIFNHYVPGRLMFLAALRKVKDDPIVRAWYERRVHQEGGNKLKGIVAVMRKLVRALWHVAVHGGVFDARRLFDVRRLEPQGAGAAGS